MTGSGTLTRWDARPRDFDSTYGRLGNTQSVHLQKHQHAVIKVHAAEHLLLPPNQPNSMLKDTWMLIVTFCSAHVLRCSCRIRHISYGAGCSFHDDREQQQSFRSLRTLRRAEPPRGRWRICIDAALPSPPLSCPTRRPLVLTSVSCDLCLTFFFSFLSPRTIYVDLRVTVVNQPPSNPRARGLKRPKFRSCLPPWNPGQKTRPLPRGLIQYRH